MRKRAATARTSDPSQPAGLRRVPQQARSRARVEVILRTARRLIGEGRDVSMREIASAAKVPIASVYQYFPDKNALLRALLIRFYDRMRSRLEAALTLVCSVDDVPTFTDAMIDGLVAEFGAARAHFNVWAAAQSSELLRELDMKDALELADLVVERFLSLSKGADARAIRDISVFAVVMAGPVVRQSFVMPKAEGESLVRELKTLIRLRAESLRAGAGSS